MISILQKNIAQLWSKDNGDYDGVVDIFFEFFSLCLCPMCHAMTMLVKMLLTLARETGPMPIRTPFSDGAVKKNIFLLCCKRYFQKKSFINDMCCLAMFSSQFRGRGRSLIIALSTFGNISAPSMIGEFLTLMMTTVAKQWSVGQRLILYVHPYSPVPIKIGVLYRPPLIPHVVSTIFFFELLQCGLYWRKKIKKIKVD